MKFKTEDPKVLDIKSRLVVLENEIDEMFERLPAASASALKSALKGHFGADEFSSAPAYEQAQFRGIAAAVKRNEDALARLTKPRF